ncbi:hypothetical protein HZA39_04150 [Candidatus Peregrinibacteria bacterium]|nr:hypothetical protein [Candidatus Peregrinibacteria bacterium]
MQIPPEKPSMKSFFLRLIAGVIAGITGALILLVSYLVMATYIEPIINPATSLSGETTVHPMFTFLFMVIIFIAILATNLIGSFLMGIFVKERYTRLSESISKILFLNLMIFVLMIPLYLVVANIDVRYLFYAVILQIFLSSQASILTLEIVSNPVHAIIGVYSTTIGILLSGGILFLINKFSLTSMGLFFGVFPAVWIFMSLSHGLLSLFYGMMVEASGKDFLAINRE